MNLSDHVFAVNPCDLPTGFPVRDDYSSDEDYEIDCYEWLLDNRPPGVLAPPPGMPCETEIDRESATMAWDGMPTPHRGHVCPGLSTQAVAWGHSYVPPHWSEWPMQAEDGKRRSKPQPREKRGLDARAVADIGVVRRLRHLRHRDDAQKACKAVDMLLTHINVGDAAAHDAAPTKEQAVDKTMVALTMTSMGEGEVRKLARARAESCRMRHRIADRRESLLAGTAGIEGRLDALEDRVERAWAATEGMTFIDSMLADIAAEDAAEPVPATEAEIERSRRESPAWWRRRIRKDIGRGEAHVAAMLGMVGGNSPFVSHYGFEGWKGMKDRTGKWAEGQAMASPDGKLVPIVDLIADAREARKSQLYAMTVAMQEHARHLGYEAVFLTLTLPGEWHPNAVNQTTRTTPYDPSLSPWAANRKLRGLWHCVMAACNRATRRRLRVRLFGVSVVEPHKDGTPHLHVMLYVHPDDVARLEGHIGDHFPGERQATIKRWEQREGGASAASYVMKYVMKTLDGEVDAALTDDADADPDGHDSGERYAAWASRLGLRRFSLVGLARGTIGRWRAIHRTLDRGETDEPNPLDDDPGFRRVRKAMSKGQWRRALVLLGAFCREEEDPESDFTTMPWATRYEVRIDRHGAAYKAAAAMVNTRTGAELVLRPVKWTMVAKATARSESDDAVSIVSSYPRAGFPPHPGDGKADPEDMFPDFDPLTEFLPLPELPLH